MARARGYPNAQYQLGWVYQTGDGVAQNYDNACEWYEEAAAQGGDMAKEALNRLHRFYVLECSDLEQTEQSSASAHP